MPPYVVIPDIHKLASSVDYGAALEVRVAGREVTVDNPVTSRRRCHAADPRPAVLTLGRRRRPVRSRCLSEGRRTGDRAKGLRSIAWRRRRTRRRMAVVAERNGHVDVTAVPLRIVGPPRVLPTRALVRCVRLAGGQHIADS